MPYLGNIPPSEFRSIDYQDFTGVTGSPVKRGFTLTSPVGSANDLEIFVNNVRQEPGVAYTVAGTALTMTGDVETTDDFYVVYQGKAVASVVPTDGSVTSAKLDTNIAVAGDLDVGTIRSTNGTTAATIDSSGRILTPARPAFHVYKTADQALSGNSIVTWDAASVNIGSCFSLTDNEFTAPITGLYFIQLTLRSENSTTITNEQLSTYCYKNDVNFKQMTQLLTADDQLSNSHVSSSFVDLLTAGDVIHFQAAISGTGPSIGGESTGRQTYASGFLVG